MSRLIEPISPIISVDISSRRDRTCYCTYEGKKLIERTIKPPLGNDFSTLLKEEEYGCAKKH